MVQNLHGCVSEDVHCIQTSAVNKSSILSEQNCALEKLKKIISYDRIGLIISFMQGGKLTVRRRCDAPPHPPTSHLLRQSRAETESLLVQLAH